MVLPELVPLFVEVSELLSEPVVVPERVPEPVAEPEPVTEPEPVAEPLPLVVPVRDDEPDDDPVELVSDEQPQSPTPKLQEMTIACKRCL